MKPNYSPVYLLRSYIWQVLKANTSMSETNYDSNADGVGLVPIVPVSEEPELVVFDKPYLVYGYALDSTGPLHAKKRGSMTFAVYSTNFGEITNILNIIESALGRQDESAKDVNLYTSTISQFIGIRFGTIGIGFVEGPTAEETEGGRQSGIINIKFEYYVDYEVKTTPTLSPTGTIVGWTQ